MQYYNIVKFYQNPAQSPSVQPNFGRVTLEQARRICQDPEMSSKTALKACNNNQSLIDKWHNKQKHWFYGFRAI